MDENNSDTEAILLVDDNPTNLQVLYQTLEGVGCKLLIAKNGEIALSIAGKALPDLILLDIMMPGIDGFEVCGKLKSDTATADIPVIFLSALGETEDKVKGLRLGAVDYITKPFQSEEVIARVNTHLTIHRLRREVETQKDQLEHELKVVSEVQRRLLPKRLPIIEGLKLSVHYETSRYAGGDYYDIIELPDNRWGFLIADAEGHSAPAAVLMAMTCALFRACPDFRTDPAEVLNYLNEHLCKVAGPSFMTALFAVYDAGKQTMRIARAGHPLPMIYRSVEKKATELHCRGLYPLGIESYDRPIPVTETKLNPGDRFLVYTDGITERFNVAEEAYGEQRLLIALSTNSAGSHQEIIAAIREDVDRFAGDHPADDDQALLLGIVE
jgi:sigma-B regulation protein RsbU (phosphoserine phosphatase)